MDNVGGSATGEVFPKVDLINLSFVHPDVGPCEPEKREAVSQGFVVHLGGQGGYWGSV